jgi:hypothetical protein
MPVGKLMVSRYRIIYDPQPVLEELAHLAHLHIPFTL